jgi:hypothetical protein
MKKLMNIDFKKDQGLILRWNYLDLTKRTKYFRHIIVLFTSNPATAKSALDGYIRHIKLGDLYTILYFSKGTARVKEWREKTNRVENGAKSHLSEELDVSFSFEQESPLI